MATKLATKKVLTQNVPVTSETRVAALRRELEATRAEFHARLARVSEAEWHKKSSTCDWTMGEVLAHLTWAVEQLPQEVQSARQGKGMFNLPNWLGAPLSYWYVRWLAREATRDALGRRYDAAMEEVVALLETVPESDWTLGADFYGEGFYSVEDLIHTPAQHLKEHLG
jgi:hypothetical protein